MLSASPSNYSFVIKILEIHLFKWFHKVIYFMKATYLFLILIIKKNE